MDSVGGRAQSAGEGRSDFGGEVGGKVVHLGRVAGLSGKSGWEMI